MKKYSVIDRTSSSNRRYIPGTMVDLSIAKIKTEDPAAEDRKNRKKVVDRIEMLVNSGIELEEACNTIVEAYKDNFKYLPKENLAQIFAGWYNGKIKAKNRIADGRTW